MSDASRTLAGIMLLSVVTIEFGGYFMTKIVRGHVPMTDFQKAFARAGHAHAGVLVTLGLVCQLLADAAGVDGVLGWVGRWGVPLAAILMSGGFFASSAGRGATGPNRFIAILWFGAASLAAGVIALGIGLLTA
ncbi:hypothetical protein [Allorhizocola rhizosphaerae]|uniref:hypothetical protein n=1 Tax=Allorhizocola rhizosphaerae TaxID=1872709 RepID=UPI000E3C7457|nr:hypothetical protein [Allorhizocola rhizosphaerae]